MPIVSPSTVEIVVQAQNKASKELDRISAELDKLEKSVDGYTSGTQAATDANKDSALSFDSLNMAYYAYAAAAAGATAAVTAFIKAYQFGELAVQNERLIAAGHEMASQFGGDMDLIIEKVRAASLGTVSDMDIIASSNKAMMLGLGADAETLANLMEIAAFRARAMGISTTQAFDDIVRGIGRSSPLILDNLGIVLKLGPVNEAYAESLGKTVDELSAAEKKQALLNAVLDEGNAMLAKAGGLVEDNASKYEQFNAQLENSKNLLLENFIPMTRFADMGTDLLLTFQELGVNGFGFGAEKLNLFSLAFQTMEKRVQAGKLELQALNLEGTVWEANQKNNLVLLSDLTTAQNTNTEALELSEEQIKAVSQANAEYLDLVSGITGELDKYAQKETDLQAKHDELIAKKQQLIAQGWSPESDKITEINQKLADNESAMQKNADEFELAGRRKILSMLEQQLAVGGLDAAETNYLLSKGLEWGVYSEQAVAAAKAAQAEVLALTAAFENLPSEKWITIRLQGVEEARAALGALAEANPDRTYQVGGYASGTGGWLTVPPGYNNDSYPVLMSSGEKFAVIPKGGGSPAGYANGTGFGNVVVNLSYSPVMSLGDETELRSRLVPLIISGVKEARAQGVIQ